MAISNITYAAKVMRGQITLDDVPEIRQSWVSWFVREHGPAEPIADPDELVVYLLKRRAREGKR